MSSKKSEIERVSASAARLSDSELRTVGGAFAAMADYDRHPERSEAMRQRDGRDSVAPHADRELRQLDDTLIAIVTLGARRPFLLRAKIGGRSFDVAPGSRNLLVMGGATQLGFTHAVPKVARCGPRISLAWRWHRSPAHTGSKPGR